MSDELELISDYVKLTACSEGIARSVYMYLDVVDPDVVARTLSRLTSAVTETTFSPKLPVADPEPTSPN
jgi:hypothetical protein